MCFLSLPIKKGNKVKTLFEDQWSPPAKLPRSFGITYRGSKSRFVKELFPAMEKTVGESLVGKNFIDPFTGGMAMSHYALVGQGMNVVASDYLPGHVDLLNAVIFDGYGLTDEFWEWVSRDTFKFKRESLSHLKRESLLSIWSFNNIEGAYLYGKLKEPIAREVHNMIVFDIEPDYSILPIGRAAFEEIVSLPDGKAVGFRERRSLFKKFVVKLIENQRLQALEAGESLASLDDFAGIKSHWQSQELERGEPFSPLSETSRLQAVKRNEPFTGRVNGKYYPQTSSRSERAACLGSINSPTLTLTCQDYQDALKSIPDNSVIYLDPPYEGTLAYSGLEKVDLNSFDIQTFWTVAEDLARSGQHVFVSSYVARPGWEVAWSKDTTSIMAGGSDTKKTVTENLYYWRGQ